MQCDTCFKHARIEIFVVYQTPTGYMVCREPICDKCLKKAKNYFMRREEAEASISKVA